MAAASSLPALVETAPEPVLIVADPLDGDLLNYECWLLPPGRADPVEQIVRAVSWMAGPFAVAAGATALALLF
ncbi:hypothetical protein [Sphingomonas lenta]|uniref:Uncharacterized protein n=1 Tax=Sphingomonas lenta TaxID=1141887 RepID=A0A2A2SAZ4_9SPHN|nr:hypothetical protein [Sphingomonas lenta]PAX06352.1 hypothetical protein CKY28_17905 [Sphingomonas lenta]